MPLSILEQIVASRLPTATPAPTPLSRESDILSSLFKEPVLRATEAPEIRAHGLFDNIPIASVAHETIRSYRQEQAQQAQTPTAQADPENINITNLREFLNSQAGLVNSFAVETPAAEAVAQTTETVATERTANTDTSGLQAIFRQARQNLDATRGQNPHVQVVNEVVEQAREQAETEERVISLFGGQVSVRG